MHWDMKHFPPIFKHLRGGCPQWHVCGDVIPLINGNCTFQTENGDTHTITGKWDLLIAHPPCTFLTAASAVRLFNPDHTIKDLEREAKGWRARDFFFSFINADCQRIAIENPAPLNHFNLPEYSQIIEPYYFGDPWKKRTCLWLKGLPLLEPSNIVEPKGLWAGSTSGRNKGTGRIKSTYTLNSKRDQKTRSKTFPGIARAMAEQWGAVRIADCPGGWSKASEIFGQVTLFDY